MSSDANFSPAIKASFPASVPLSPAITKVGVEGRGSGWDWGWDWGWG